MKVIAFHNLEDVAALLTNVTLITEVEVVSVQNLNKFQEYLKKYKFSGAYILDKFFPDAIPILLKEKKFPKSIIIFLQDEQNLEKFLKLGLTEQNIETIPFNPLSLFVKTKSLLNTLNNLEQSIKQGVKTFDFYRVGLFNLLNYLTKTNQTLFVSVKDAENEETLYSLKVVNGQVSSCSLEVEKVASINMDDSIPKILSLGPVEHKDLEQFNDTSDFYHRLLEGELKSIPKKVSVSEKGKDREKEKKEKEKEKEDSLKVELVATLKENLLRERRIYKFLYEEYEIFTQPPEDLKGGSLNNNSIFVCTELNEKDSLVLRTLFRRNPNLKILSPKLIQVKLKHLGFSENNFINLQGVKTFDFPFLGSKFEGAVLFPNGVLITGNLFGSFVSKKIPFFERVFANHLRLFHYANISSNERLLQVLQTIEGDIKRLSYIFPNYGYAINQKGIETVLDVIKKISIPEKFTTLADGWQTLTQTYNFEADSYEEFIKKLEKEDESILFNLMDEMEILGIVPFEF